MWLRAGTTLVICVLAACDLPDHPKSKTPAGLKVEWNRRTVKAKAPLAFNHQAGGGADPTGVKDAIKADRRIAGLLRGWSDASDPAKNKVVSTIRRELDELEEALLRVILAENENLIAAIEVIGRLRIEEAGQQLHLILLNGKPDARAAAIIALDRIYKWTKEELIDFLKELDEKPVIAALKVSATREFPPTSQVIACVGDSRASVRAAAIAALPERLVDPKDCLALLALTKNKDPAIAISALQAMAAVDKFPGCESRLRDIVDDHDNWNVRVAALRTLATFRQPLGPAGKAVKARIEDPKTSVEEKMSCFLALEMTDTIHPQWLKEISPKLHPVLQMHAARCLVLRSDPKGAEELIRLLSVQQGPGVDDEDVTYIRTACHAILTQLAGEDLGNDPEAWRSALPRMKRKRIAWIQFAPWKNH